MVRVAITVEGGLMSSDLLEQIAATPRDVQGQRAADFGLDRGRLSDEIQKAFSDARAYWDAFRRRLERASASSTTVTRENWVLPLLEDLGYELPYQKSAALAAGNTYRLSHRLGDDPDAPPVHIVSCEQELDRRGEARQSPHAMVQDFLNRTDALWGIVTNGRRLRLLRDTVRFSRPVFIEFDLEAIFEGNLYSEFVLFYRLVHATRFPRGSGEAHGCWLERYFQQGIEEGGRVRERLRDGVKHALELLGTGFLSHDGSIELRERITEGRLDANDYYRQLLRLIYRLLFLMVAEERRLLFVPHPDSAPRQDAYTRWYSIARLRERAKSGAHGDPHRDLWEGLKETFRLFEDSDTAAKLGLTALNGELFDRLACYELLDAGLRNDTLLTAIWRLSTFEDVAGRKKKGVRRRVNFAGLDIEELGSIYESLLEFHPEVSLDPPAFELVAGSERKTTGSYYTPPELVRELIKSALEPVIEERLSSVESTEERERELLSLKVCDPASGSGHFVLAAARRIGRELAKVRSGEAEPNPEEYRRAVRDVIRRCIYAVDKNPLAVDLCKVALWIEGHSVGLPLSFLDHHIKRGDSLIGLLDLNFLTEGVPADAYKAVTGDDKKIASDIRKRNKQEARQGTLFRHRVKDDIARVADAFGEIAEAPETSPQEVHTKEASYRTLRDQAEWKNAKAAADLWTAAFFAPLTADGKADVPTTDDVWRAISGKPPQGKAAALTTELAADQRFFHWPLEFPEVFAQGGFDVMVGNPPWERIKLQEQEFFANRSPEIANAPNKAARDRLIKDLASPDATPADIALRRDFENVKHQADAASQFIRTSGRYPLTGVGDVNTYAMFAETFLQLIPRRGRAGLIVPTGIATDDTTKRYFEAISQTRKLRSLFSFYEIRRWFPGTDDRRPFCLLTLGSDDAPASFAFDIFSIDNLTDSRKIFGLSSEEIVLLNPNTRTCPVFRSSADAELTKKIYRNVTVLIDETTEPQVNPWGISFMSMFHMSNDSKLFRNSAQLKDSSAVRNCSNWEDANGEIWSALYEAKMIHQFDHRFGTFAGFTERPKNSPLNRPTLKEMQDPQYETLPWYWVSKLEAMRRLSAKGWDRDWLICWRDGARNSDIRTLICCALPAAPVVGDLPIILPKHDTNSSALILANLNSLVADFVCRQKISGTHVKNYHMKQLPVIPFESYSEADIRFVKERVLELTYTDKLMKSFAENLSYNNPPFTWDPARRQILRAELDAYYAYLYGLTRRELEYVLDPKAVMGEDYPSETFRVLKENEIKKFGEYRTQRLVLEAWDQFVEDGTFDLARLRDPEYIDRVADALSETRERLEETEKNYRALVSRARETKRPTLFVEGATDVKIVEAAWSVFFPDGPMPVKVLAAGGTRQMGSLSGKGKALREVLGDQLVLVLADNDAEGRGLVDDGHIKKGGAWRQLPNGIHWCLLKPTEEFAAAMKTYELPKQNWPFTIESAFRPALRRQALNAGTYRFSGDPQAEFFDNPEVGKRIARLTRELDEGDDAYFYLMAPHHEAKETFAEWVTRSEQMTEENYAALEEIVRGLKDLVEQNKRGDLERRARPTVAQRGAA